MKLGDVTVTGIASLRALYVWDWFQAATGDNQYAYCGNLLAGELRRATQAVGIGTPNSPLRSCSACPTTPRRRRRKARSGSAPTTTRRTRQQPIQRMVFAKQLYVRFKGSGAKRSRLAASGTLRVSTTAAELVPKNATLATLKRDRVSQRLIGDFGWSDVGRSFDGVHYLVIPNPPTISRLSAAIPTRGVFQTDGWGWNQVGFGYASFTHEWGSGNHAADTRFFVIDYDDWRHILKTDNRPRWRPARRYGKHPHRNLRRAQPARLHHQRREPSTRSPGEPCRPAAGGHRPSAPTRSTSRAAFSPRCCPVLKPWIRGGFTIGSGDGNPNDSTHGTFFQVLPTPRPYARFPFFNMMNTEDRFGALILRPHPR